MQDNLNPQPSQPPPSTPPAAPPMDEKQARTWNMLCHLSALAGFVVPFGNVLGPLLVWQLKKNEFPSVEIHGKAALNFQISVSIVLFAGGIVALLASMVCIGPLLFPLLFAAFVAGLVFSVIAGIKANDGLEYRYPWSLNLVK